MKNKFGNGKHDSDIETILYFKLRNNVEIR